MIPRRQTLASAMALLVVLSGVASVALAVGAGVAASSGEFSSGDATTSHGAENGNYTVVFPDETPAPGAEGVSINHYSASTQEQFDEMGAPNHVNMSFIVVSSSEVDFSDCSTEDTRAFGIDRGNDDSGTWYDEDLLKHREDSHFRDNSIIVDFFEGDELAAAGDSPPTLYPVDELVAAQDSCYKMPDEAGWYQIQGYMNGTNSDGDYVEVSIPSHYFWVCDCENEQEAREELGPPPSERDEMTPTPTESDDSTPTPTPTESDDSTPTDSDDSTPTSTPDDDTQDDSTDATPTQTATADGTDGGDGGDGGDGSDSSGGNGDGDSADGGGGNDVKTPSPGDGPGLGVVAALLALAAAGLLAVRRS